MSLTPTHWSLCRPLTTPTIEDGIYTDAEHPAPPTEGQKTSPKSRTLLTIPSKVISRAVGLAIFTTGRVGFHVSGSTGSGVLIARLPDGSWSPPSGIQVHSLGAGFVIGLDIYDCVVVINTKEALDAFTRTRLSLGSDLAVVAGPWGAGGSLDFAAPSSDKAKSKSAHRDGTPSPVGERPTQAGFTRGPAAPAQPQGTTGVNAPQSTNANLATGDTKERKASPLRTAISHPVYSYVKSRGFYAGVQIDGTVVTERKDANAAFYGEQVPVQSILAGQVPGGPWHAQTRLLQDVLRGAEGWRNQQQGQTAGAPVGSNSPSTSPGGYAGPQGGAPFGTATTGTHQTYPGTGQPAQPGYDKAQEAARESAAAPAGPAPPGYTPMAEDEEPPAYIDNGQIHPGAGDAKTAYH